MGSASICKLTFIWGSIHPLFNNFSPAISESQVRKGSEKRPMPMTGCCNIRINPDLLSPFQVSLAMAHLIWYFQHLQTSICWVCCIFLRVSKLIMARVASFLNFWIVTKLHFPLGCQGPITTLNKSRTVWQGNSAY